MAGDRGAALSPRLRAVVEALPFEPTSRVLEIGCGPGAAARAIADRLTTGHVLATDRSARAVAQAVAGSRRQIEAGRMSVRQVAAEDLVLLDGEAAYDVVLACRVGALDGRHPAAGRLALTRIAAVLAPGGRVFVDTGDPLRELPV